MEIWLYQKKQLHFYGNLKKVTLCYYMNVFRIKDEVKIKYKLKIEESTSDCR